MTSVRLARSEEAPLLPPIEMSAGRLFRSLPDLAWIAGDEVQPASAYLPLIAAGTVWVAEAEGALAGFNMCERIGDALHVWELAVAEDAQGRGLGRALLGTAVAHGRAEGLREVTLTTFRHVAWNAPFYAGHGFVEVTNDARLNALVRSEEGRGLPNRCAMSLRLM